MGCIHVILESDSLTIISKLRSVVDDLSVLQTYISDAKTLSRVFVSCRFAFTPRSENGVTYCLARLKMVWSSNRYRLKKSISPSFFFGSSGQSLLGSPVYTLCSVFNILLI
ncbi:hypothetical protein V6N13_109600 [Hibiscus sabdariffa]|uniref:RNase H type-1 domain-containing protein n=1 Tax=Hibiscus sabdariffa TaxID=183260 RepID=A0ABR2FQC6_9ROSI